MTRATISHRFVLPAKPEDFLGEVRVSVQLENYKDATGVFWGQLAPDAVRRATINMPVDTGASMLLLPRDVVDRLGLETIDRIVVEYADGRRDELDVAGIVRLSVGGRTAEVRAIVGPEGTEPLLGQVPLEILDLLVDCGQQRLVPRPESPSRPFSRL